MILRANPDSASQMRTEMQSRTVVISSLVIREGHQGKGYSIESSRFHDNFRAATAKDYIPDSSTARTAQSGYQADTLSKDL